MWGKNQKSPNEGGMPIGPPGQMGEAAARETPSWTYIGAGTTIQGDVTGRENLMIEGEIAGKVRVASAGVEVGTHGRVHADIEARDINVHGEVRGTIRAAERLHIGASGVVHGNVSAQRIAIEDGAILHGAVEVLRPGQSKPSADVSKTNAASAAPAQNPKGEMVNALAGPAQTSD